jgi:signal transduction histidine kinase
MVGATLCWWRSWHQSPFAGARAEEDQVREARQAVADERARIAHELHDVVAHSLSVMVVQATAGQRLIGHDPKRAEQSLSSIGETGRAALAEMRRILGVFDTRSVDESGKQELAPQPGLADIDTLLQGCRSAGMFIVDEREALFLDNPALSLGAGIELAVFRVIQEAFTNVLKHAGTASVVLRLQITPSIEQTTRTTTTTKFTGHQADRADPLPSSVATSKLGQNQASLLVEITDNGLGLAASKPADGLGRGMIGMRARIDSVGGEFHAGSRAGGGWIVRAAIPLLGVVLDARKNVKVFEGANFESEKQRVLT